MKRTLAERFTSKVSPEPNSGCWLWTGVVNSKGYAAIADGGGMRLAHRVSYQLNRGRIPSGLVLDHLCRVRCCVNPDHLEAVTQKQNIRRGRVMEVSGEWQRVKTHCPAGHPYSPENTYRSANGHRQCLACCSNRMRIVRAGQRKNS